MSWHVTVELRIGALDLTADVRGGAGPVALVGPNASGKTTLLRTIAGAHRPERGRIEIGGRVLFDSEEGIDLPPERRGVGYVPQGYGLFPHLRVVDNVAFGVRADGARPSRAERRAVARELLGRMGSVHLADRWPATLSGGEKQRVALARTLMVDPAILLLDEPLAALDAPARRKVRSWLAGHLAARRRPTIVVTHDPRDVRGLAADVHVLEGGRIVQRGSPEALAAAPATEFVAELFG